MILADLATVLILVALSVLGLPNNQALWQTLGLALLEAAVFIGLMLFVGTRAIPWMLRHIVQTRSRELFILFVLVIALGTALGSAELFHVSLALGAFFCGCGGEGVASQPSSGSRCTAIS